MVKNAVTLHVWEKLSESILFFAALGFVSGALIYIEKHEFGHYGMEMFSEHVPFATIKILLGALIFCYVIKGIAPDKYSRFIDWQLKGISHRTEEFSIVGGCFLAGFSLVALFVGEVSYFFAFLQGALFFLSLAQLSHHTHWKLKFPNVFTVASIAFFILTIEGWSLPGAVLG